MYAAHSRTSQYESGWPQVRRAMCTASRDECRRLVEVSPRRIRRARRPAASDAREQPPVAATQVERILRHRYCDVVVA